MPLERKFPDHAAPSPGSLSRRCALGSLLTAGTALIPAGAGGAEEPSRRRSIIDASAYGVAADGNTDDAPALLRAVAAMSNGSALELPAGTIALGSTGWSGILIRRLMNIRIQGNATILKWLARPSQSTAGFGPTGLRFYECQGVVVADIAIDGNGVDCIGLGLDTCTSCVVRGVEAYAHGVAKEKSSAGQFASSRGTNNRWQACVARDATPESEIRGFYLGNANSGWGDTDLRIEGCVARQNTATGFAIEAVRMVCVNCVSEGNGGAGFTSSTANGSPSTDHVFQGNVARQNAFHGWQTDVYGPDAQRIALTGNIFSENAFSGVFCHKGTTVSVAGNVITDNGRMTASAGVGVSMSNGVTVSGNLIEGDATHGVCVSFNYPTNRVRDVIVSNNQCRGSNSRTIWIEASEPSSSLQRVVATGNIVSGGSHGFYLGTSAAGAVFDDVTIANNIVHMAQAASYFIADHAPGQSTNMRLTGNTGSAPNVGANVRLTDNRANSWNVYQGGGTAAPNSGVWQRGAIIFNSAPSPGSPVGWVCTASGEPGSWSRFGAIGA
jgi:hypothetical protein